MQKTCPNGHVYDPAIYGDQCPICPPAVSAPAGAGPATHLGNAPAAPAFGGADLHTHIAGAAPQAAAFAAQQRAAAHGAPDVSGPTSVRPQSQGPAANGGHTMIRRAPGKPGAVPSGTTRKLVGFLVTYNRDPNGRAYNIYEGRNFVGRDPGCDISVPDDDQMSGRHMSILYRAVDNKFKFRDEQSSNGTFVNKELLDDGELENNDIIRAGSTLFVFIAIPNFF